MNHVLPNEITDYDTAVSWIYHRIDYERIEPQTTSPHFRLERIERLLSVIGSPQQRIPALHIAGTKGKGSTAAILNSILVASDVKVGLFTSPHIHLFEERMQINSAMPSREELTSLVSELKSLLQNADRAIVEDGPTYFEVATLLAWMYFDRHSVEIVVLETGLGGRLDCTNVCRPLLTIITAIGMDHTHILGHTITAIAGEKAGIIKDQIPVLTWPASQEAQDVIERRASHLNCSLELGPREIRVLNRSIEPGGQVVSLQTPRGRYRDLFLPLAGEHQSRNAALAVAAADLIGERDHRVNASTIAAGLRRVSWPLRFEIVAGRPPVILDAAHNEDAVHAFLATFRETQMDDRSERVLIFSSSQDKDAAAMLKQLLPAVTTVILTKFQTNPRATAVAELRQLCDGCDCRIIECETPADALKQAKSITSADGVICGTGSIFLAAELRAVLRT